MNELNILDFLKKKIKLSSSTIIGPGDDAALLRNFKQEIVFCGDMLIEDVHFKLKDATFFDIGYKSVARTLSDIAAVSAVPKYIGISLALPKKYSSKIKEFLSGVEVLLKRFKIDLVGGDLSCSKKIFVDVWAIGFVEKNRFVKRSGAKPGDSIFVTGTLGGSYKGKHKKFLPLIEKSRKLTKEFKINSMMDISDGLAVDLYRILKESKVGAKIYQKQIPLSKDALTLEDGLYSGEDYELLFTANPKNKQKLIKKGFFYIGDIIKGKELLLCDDKKTKKLKTKGFVHFS